MDWITDPQAWIALATLTVLEIVLGIDNVIFISVMSGRLPEGQQAKARTLGLALAMLLRIVLLTSIAWLAGLTADLFVTPCLLSLVDITKGGPRRSGTSHP